VSEYLPGDQIFRRFPSCRKCWDAFNDLLNS